MGHIMKNGLHVSGILAGEALEFQENEWRLPGGLWGREYSEANVVSGKMKKLAQRLVWH